MLIFTAEFPISRFPASFPFLCRNCFPVEQNNYFWSNALVHILSWHCIIVSFSSLLSGSLHPCCFSLAHYLFSCHCATFALIDCETAISDAFTTAGVMCKTQLIPVSSYVGTVLVTWPFLYCLSLAYIIGSPLFRRILRGRFNNPDR